MIEKAVLQDKKTKKSKLKDDQKNTLMRDAGSEWLSFNYQITQLREQSTQMRQLYAANIPDMDSEQFTQAEVSISTSSQVRSGVMAQAIDAIHAQQHMTKFPAGEQFFEGVPQNPTAKEKQDQYEAYTRQRLGDIDFLIKYFNYEKLKMLDGVCAVATPYIRRVMENAVDYEPRRLFGLIPIPGAPPKRVVKDVVDFEGTDFVPLSFEQWVINPQVDSLDKSPFLYYYYKTPEELQAIQAYANTEDLEPYCEHLTQNSTYERIKYEYGGITANYTIGENNSALHQSHILVMERWGDFWIDGKLYKNHVLVWANDSIFLYFGPNPYDHQRKPFIVSPYIPMPHTLYGKSAGKDCIESVHAYDTLGNQIIDACGKVASPAFTYLDTDTTLAAYIGDDDFTLGCAEMIPVKSHASLQQIVINLQGLELAMNTRQQLKEEIRESTGGVPYTTGGVDQEGQDRTLGEVEILANGTGTRFQCLIDYDERSTLKPFIEMTFTNDRQFGSQDVYVDQFATPLNADDVRLMKMRWTVTGSKSAMDHNKQIGDLLNFATQILPPLFENGFAVPSGEVMEVDLPGMVQDIIRLANIKNGDQRIKVVASQTQVSQAATNPNMPQGGDVQDVTAGIPGLNPHGANPVMAATGSPPGVPAPQGQAQPPAAA